MFPVEYVIIWPADAKIGVMRDRWSYLPDGSIQAHYTRFELALMLITIGKLNANDVDLFEEPSA